MLKVKNIPGLYNSNGHVDTIHTRISAYLLIQTIDLAASIMYFCLHVNREMDGIHEVFFQFH